jgi:hypothetical protein
MIRKIFDLNVPCSLFPKTKFSFALMLTLEVKDPKTLHDDTTIESASVVINFFIILNFN